MQRFVVTGANKGIGLAVVKGLLDTNKNTFVFLGSRDSARGQSAVQSIVSQNSDLYSGRVEALEIDVSDAESVSRAADTVRARLNDESAGTASSLAGLINNAGVAIMDFSPASFKTVMEVNFRGVTRATEAFMPLLDPSKGRVVITSSASGPMFVAKCSAERQASMVDPAVTNAQILELLDECLSIAADDGGNVAKKFADAGMTGGENMSGYGVSKALVNMYTMQLAREHPSLLVNACTPGFIKTDLSIPIAGDEKSLDEMGAKSPSDGAKVIVHLAVGDVSSSGWFYGSDIERSPLDRYRGPGSPPYDGK